MTNPVSDARSKPSRSPGTVVAALVLFFPLGLFWMWQGRTWSPKVRWIVTGVVGVVAIAAAGSGGSSKTPDASTAASTATQPSATTNAAETEAQKAAAAKAAADKAAADKVAADKVAATKAAENGPPNEQAFNAAVTTGRNSFDGTTNEIKQGQAQAMRNQAICSAVSGLQVTNWVGKINSINTNGSGKGALELQIGPDSKIATWNNAVSDVVDDTLIPQSSPIYATLANLGDGDKIMFSGTFFHDSESCLEEQSLTKAGKMDTPNFVFRFTSLVKS